MAHLASTDKMGLMELMVQMAVKEIKAIPVNKVLALF